jgi:hypothetical protein
MSSSTVLTAQCSGGNAVDVATPSIPYTTGWTSSIQTISTFSAYAPLLQLMYEISDISTATSSSTTTPSGSQEPARQGLSTGASAGIGVGVGLGVILLATAAFWFWRMKRGTRKNTKAPRPEPFSNAEDYHENKPAALGPKTAQELQGHYSVPEIGSETVARELVGSEPNKIPTSPIELA